MAWVGLCVRVLRNNSPLVLHIRISKPSPVSELIFRTEERCLLSLLRENHFFLDLNGKCIRALKICKILLHSGRPNTLLKENNICTSFVFS
jgi:hypothetical protein